MSAFKQRLLTNWHLIRIFRLAIGLWMLALGIYTRDWMVGLFSGFFLYQAVTDTGCCGTQGCYTPPVRKSAGPDKDPETIEYEEIK